MQAGWQGRCVRLWQQRRCGGCPSSSWWQIRSQNPLQKPWLAMLRQIACHAAGHLIGLMAQLCHRLCTAAAAPVAAAMAAAAMAMHLIWPSGWSASPGRPGCRSRRCCGAWRGWRSRRHRSRASGWGPACRNQTAPGHRRLTSLPLRHPTCNTCILPRSHNTCVPCIGDPSDATAVQHALGFM
jgi:hypothetical protein